MARPTHDPSLLQAVLDRTGDPATVAWAHDGQGTLATLADPALAIAAAEKLANVAALQAVVAPKDLKKAAAAALHRLRSRGVEVQATVAPSTFTLTAERNELPSRAFLSVPDRDGDIELLLTASDAEGNCVLAIILGGPDLIRETRHAHISRGEIRNLWSQILHNRMHTELPFTAGLHYAERLLAPRGDHDWRHFLDHVPNGTLQSARILDPLARLPEADPEEPIPPRWMVPPPLLALTRLEEGVSKLLDIMSSNLVNDEEQRKVIIDERMANTADDSLDDAARARIEQYCELVMAATLHRGWARHAARFEAVRAEMANKVPGRDVESVLAAVRLYLAENVMRYASQFSGGDPGELPMDELPAATDAPAEAP